MSGHVIGLGLTLVILTMIALSWPFRRLRGLTIKRRIDAPRERVWDAYVVNSDGSNRALHDKTVSVTPVEGEAGLRDHVIDASHGHRTNLIVARIRTLTDRPPALHESHHCKINEAPEPFGPEELTRFELSERPGGCEARLSWRGRTATLWQYLAIWRSHRRHMTRLKEFSETGSVAPESESKRSIWTSLILSAVAVGSFALLLGWFGAIMLGIILVIHEFGHWLAMRLTGQPAPRMMLIPFLGGVAVANHPHKTLFDDAFCALMGPGFSVLPCAALVAVSLYLGLPEGGGVPTELSDVAVSGAVVAIGLALAVGIVNAFQLLPVLPLDGGQVLRAVIQSFSSQWARRILLLITCTGMAAFGYFGDYILAALLGLGALQAWHMNSAPSGARPMGPPGLTAIGLGYGLCLAVHGGTVFYALGYFLDLSSPIV